MSTPESDVVEVRPRLRPARPADLPAVEDLLHASQLPTVGVAEAFATFVVAEHHAQIVGVAGLELCDDDGLLRSVAVTPSWRKSGLGGALVGAAIAMAESRRLHGLYLLTTTAASYFPAFGFAAIDRQALPRAVRETEEFTAACPASAVAMARVLDSSTPAG